MCSYLSIYLYLFQPFHDTFLRGPRGVMVKALDCGLVVSEFIHFRTNTLGKGMNPLSSQLWVK